MCHTTNFFRIAVNEQEKNDVHKQSIEKSVRKKPLHISVRYLQLKKVY